MGWGVVASGLLGVFCSVMIYVATQREFWSFERTVLRFSLTTALLGLATFWMAMTWAIAIVGTVPPSSLDAVASTLARGVLGIAVLKLVGEGRLFRSLLSPHVTTLRRSAQLHVGPLIRMTLGRFLFGGIGGIVLPYMCLAQGQVYSPIRVTLIVAALLIGELLERYLYFAAVAAPRMPGSVRT